MFQFFVITLLKRIKYKNRLTFAHYSITFWDFKSLQGVPKTWKVLKSKNKFFKKTLKYRNTVYYDFKSQFLVIFSSIYRHRLVLEIPFSDHIFPNVSKHCTENLQFSSTGKYYALYHSPTPAPPPFKNKTSSFLIGFCAFMVFQYGYIYFLMKKFKEQISDKTFFNIFFNESNRTTHQFITRNLSIERKSIWTIHVINECTYIVSP